MPQTGTRDYYGILGLAPGASEEEIRHAFRRLAKLWHPDRYRMAPDDLRQQAERRMRRLTEAYSMLGDAERRADYDAQLGLAASGRQPVAKGISFGPATRFTVPGYQMSRAWQADTTDAHGLGTFVGLLSTVVALAALLSIRSATGGPGSLLAIIVMLAAAVLACLSFTNQGPVWHIVRAATRPAPIPTPPPHPPEAHPTPDPTPFEELIQEALRDLPSEFAETLENIAIVIESEPGYSLLRRLGARPGSTLLGLYEGVPLIRQRYDGAPFPERITLYQGPIERYCHFDAERIRHQVKATLLHELAHHFGMDHDEMPLWVKAE